jgi:hypothetical protein
MKQSVERLLEESPVREYKEKRELSKDSSVLRDTEKSEMKVDILQCNYKIIKKKNNKL